MKKKMVSTSQKTFSPNRNKLPQATGRFLKNWTPPDFNSGFHQQKESSKFVAISRNKITF